MAHVAYVDWFVEKGDDIDPAYTVLAVSATIMAVLTRRKQGQNWVYPILEWGVNEDGTDNGPYELYQVPAPNEMIGWAEFATLVMNADVR